MKRIRDIMLAMLVYYGRNSLLKVKSLLDGDNGVQGSPGEAEDPALEITGRHRFDLVADDRHTEAASAIPVRQRLRGLSGYARLPMIRFPVVRRAAASRSPVCLAAVEPVATEAPPTMSDRVGFGARLRALMIMSSALRARDDQAARLAREVEAATRKLHDREEEMIFRLSLAVEYRDSDTGEHTLRVARYSRMIAEALGLSPEDCRGLYLAAPLHDIGKVAVPDRVLLKPGRLTAEETEVVRTHAAVGERILGDSASDLMRLAAEIAGHHHERWDGTGYPRGLAGEAIPLSARIVAVADVFDAMTTERPYKAALPVKAALDGLAAERGLHFDPRCVDAFLHAYARLHPDLRRVERDAGAPDPCTDVAFPLACA